MLHDELVESSKSYRSASGDTIRKEVLINIGSLDLNTLPENLSAVAAKNKLDAVKILKEHYKIGLLEAKILAEHLQIL